MRNPTWLTIAALAASSALAQQPAPQQPVPPQPAGPQPGFFSPTIPTVLSGLLESREAAPGVAAAPPATGEAAAFGTQSREALEREMDRAQRESRRAREEAARRPPPMIASPLDGTAPIVSPLDGSR